MSTPSSQLLSPASSSSLAGAGGGPGSSLVVSPEPLELAGFAAAPHSGATGQSDFGAAPSEVSSAAAGGGQKKPPGSHKTEYKSKFTPFDQYVYNEVTDSFVRPNQYNSPNSSQHSHLSVTTGSAQHAADSAIVLISASELNDVSSVSSHQKPASESYAGGSQANSDSHQHAEPWYKEVQRRNEKANEYRFKSEVGHSSPLLSYAHGTDTAAERLLASPAPHDLTHDLLSPRDQTSTSRENSDFQSESSSTGQHFRFTPLDYKRDHLIAHLANNNNFNLPKEETQASSRKPYDTKAAGNSGSRIATASTARSRSHTTTAAAAARARSQSSRRIVPATTVKSTNMTPTKRLPPASRNITTTTTAPPPPPATSTLAATNTRRPLPIAGKRTGTSTSTKISGPAAATTARRAPMTTTTRVNTTTRPNVTESISRVSTRPTTAPRKPATVTASKTLSTKQPQSQTTTSASRITSQTLRLNGFKGVEKEQTKETNKVSALDIKTEKALEKPEIESKVNPTGEPSIQVQTETDAQEVAAPIVESTLQQQESIQDASNAQEESGLGKVSKEEDKDPEPANIVQQRSRSSSSSSSSSEEVVKNDTTSDHKDVTEMKVETVEAQPVNHEEEKKDLDHESVDLMVEETAAVPNASQSYLDDLSSELVKEVFNEEKVPFEHPTGDNTPDTDSALKSEESNMGNLLEFEKESKEDLKEEQQQKTEYDLFGNFSEPSNDISANRKTTTSSSASSRSESVDQINLTNTPIQAQSQTDPQEVAAQIVESILQQQESIQDASSTPEESGLGKVSTEEDKDPETANIVQQRSRSSSSSSSSSEEVVKNDTTSDHKDATEIRVETVEAQPVNHEEEKKDFHERIAIRGPSSGGSSPTSSSASSSLEAMVQNDINSDYEELAARMAETLILQPSNLKSDIVEVNSSDKENEKPADVSGNSSSFLDTTSSEPLKETVVELKQKQATDELFDESRYETAMEDSILDMTSSGNTSADIVNIKTVSGTLDNL